MSVSENVVRDWLDSFGKVWRESDAKTAAEIMTEDGSYRNSPFLDEAYVGHEAIEGFWINALVNVSDVDFRYGAPVIDGDRVAVEWWTFLRSSGEPFTLAGIFLLTFVGDKVTDLREAYVKEAGTRQPHAGWGV